MYLFDKSLHAIQHGMHLEIDINAIDDFHITAWRSQSCVQYGPVFCEIDFLTGEHCVTLTPDLSFPCQLTQHLQRALLDLIF